MLILRDIYCYDVSAWYSLAGIPDIFMCILSVRWGEYYRCDCQSAGGDGRLSRLRLAFTSRAGYSDTGTLYVTTRYLLYPGSVVSLLSTHWLSVDEPQCSEPGFCLWKDIEHRLADWISIWRVSDNWWFLLWNLMEYNRYIRQSH